MFKPALVSTTAIIALALAGCNTSNVKSDAGAPVPGVSAPAVTVPNVGFLSDYTKLQPVEGASGSYRYLNKTVSLSAYNKIFIEPVQVIVDQSAEYKGLPPNVIQRMVDSVRAEFVGALQSGYQVVNAPGADVIRIRSAITGVQAVKPDLSATDFIPIKAIFNAARSASGGAPRVAEMSGEMEVLDPSGQVVGAAVSTRKADKNLAQGEQVSWNDMKAISAVWAKNLRQQLDSLRGVK